MIILKTVYPCTKCQQEIDPNTPHCPQCGKKQDHSNEEHFNIFTPPLWGGQVYNLVYGATILAWEDIAELALEQSGNGCFIGAYIPADQNLENQINLTKWIPLINGQPGLDQGAQTIKTTNLE